MEVGKRQTAKGRDWIKLVPGLLVSIVAFAVVFRFVDLNEVVDAVRLANPRYVLAGGLMMLCWLTLRSLAWRALIQPSVPYRKVFLTLNQGYLLNNFLPFRLGEVGRAFLLSRKTGLGFWRVFSSVVIERTIDVVFCLGLFLMTLPFAFSGQTASRAAAAAVVVVAFMGLVVLRFIAKYPDRALRFFGRLTSWSPRLSKHLETVLSPFFAGLSILTDARRFVQVIALFALNLALAVVQYYLLMLAFFPEARPVWAAFALAVSAMGLALPSSPGGLGVFEGAVVGGLAAFGLDPSRALAYAITLHAWNYALTGALGTYALIAEGQSLRSLYHGVRHSEQV
jgi:glycosyltransferase 2 family protein